MTAAEIAARMADPVALARAGVTASDDSEGLSPARMIGAAVLVPIVLHPAPSVLLTLRAAKMSSHAGQVSFPGGRIEADETPEAAAVREAAEEVGLDPRLPELLGRLPHHATGTGFRITPVVGLVLPPLNLTPEPGEVEEAFELPLSLVLDPQAPERRHAEFRGRMREFWVWPHERHYIWGATAAILVNLARVLRG
ncbi:CoA pyrophosphatase [Belnapia sp. T18]|uniref:CoA pyrophosphatase n=1 Tax=Belnapia arida TaxID=2804533 RepID=A0ABS1TVS6_9PROT|nr:CoA pyrophosphatase [Belnapia arida]MBL6076547.1 CoA pyrophosphatase [Belnapia arida]